MFERRRLRKRLEAAADLTAAAADGVVARATGVVRALERELVGPTSGRACVAFGARVVEPTRHEPGGFDPPQPYSCVDVVPFVLECQLGGDGEITRVIVDSVFAELVMPIDHPERFDDDAWTAFCDDRRLSPRTHGTACLVRPGMRVTVLGTTMWRTTVPGVESGFRSTAMQLCLVGDFDHPLVIVDAAERDDLMHIA